MLHTNLSTRPFYNERAVRTGLVAVALVAIGLTAFNVVQVMRLSARSNELRQQALQAENETRGLRGKERAVRRSLDQAQIDAVQVAAREANLLIDRRVFSWTDLFNRFEQTLPPNVRISAVTPQVDADGRLVVAVVVVSRRVEDLNEFADALEETRAFKGALSRTDEPQDDGTIRSVLQAFYAPSTVPVPPASESSSRPPGNETAADVGSRESGVGSRESGAGSPENAEEREKPDSAVKTAKPATPKRPEAGR